MGSAQSSCGLDPADGLDPVTAAGAVSPHMAMCKGVAAGQPRSSHAGERDMAQPHGGGRAWPGPKLALGRERGHSPTLI